MIISTAAQATLLLTSYFSKPVKGSIKPLTPTEWGAFAQWLHEQGHTPADLLVQDSSDILQGWSHPKVTRERLQALLQRGSSMALSLEKWQRSGLWVITRSDSGYPRRLKKRLKHAAPPVLFGCGNVELLNTSGLAVVGSRKAGDEDLTYARRVGAIAAKAAVGIVSGGARGIDEAAMQGAIQEGGSVTGILSEGLLKAATSSQWRQGLMSGGLVLVSPYYPEASFHTGNAMGRNKYIYCLADAAMVVHSGSSGGTKAGAEENLKRGWVPLWVKPTKDLDAGNHALVRAGGAWCEENVEQLDIGSMFTAAATHSSQQMPDQPDTVSSREPDISTRESDINNDIETNESEADKAQSDVANDIQYELANSEPKPPITSEDTDQKVSQKAVKAPQPDLFGGNTANNEKAEVATLAVVPEQATDESNDTMEPDAPLADPAAHRIGADPYRFEQIDFYQLFLNEMQRLAKSPMTVDEITAETGLHKTQVTTWLKQAVGAGKVEKLARPVKYRAIPVDPSK